LVLAKRALPNAAVAEPRAVTRPVFTGAALRPATFRYALKGEVKGQPVAGTSTLTVAVGTRDRRPVWTIDEESRTAAGVETDTTVLDKKTMLPLGRTVRQGDVGVDLAFSDKEVVGQVMKGDGHDLAIRTSNDGALLTDGMPLNLAVATLPLKQGYVAQVRSLATATGKTQMHYVVVKELEAVDTPAGKFDAYRVLIGPVDALSRMPDVNINPALGAPPPPGSSMVWIERAAPRRILRWERVLPDGTVSVELVNGGSKTPGQVPTSSLAPARARHARTTLVAR
jgi:hypothetical protein